MRKDSPGIIGWIFRSFLFLLNILAAIWLLLCGAAAVISPTEYKYLALFSLTTPFAIVVNICFILLWLFSWRLGRSLLSIVTLIACHKVALTIFGLNFFEPNEINKKTENTLKVMTWNVHGMGIFNRPRNKDFETRIINYLREQNADILCLPEYYTPRSNILKPHSHHILKNSGYKEYRFNVDNDLGPESYLGTAFFSKYPIRNYEVHRLSRYIFMLQSDVLLPGGVTVRMYGLHLNTFGLSDNEKAYIEEVKQRKKDIDSSLDVSKSFASRFANAFVRRAEEAINAATIIKQSPHPVLICGDFNDLPGSYTYTLLRGDLKDAFIERGRGLGRTYGQISPTLRIDHMFYDPAALRIIGFDTQPTDLSDHYPVIANFEIIGQPAR